MGFESEPKKGGGGSLVQTLRNIDKEGSESLIWAWGLGRNKVHDFFVVIYPNSTEQQIKKKILFFFERVFI